MEDPEETTIEGNLGIGNTEETFPWDEWTVIEDKDNAKINRTASQQNEPREMSSREPSHSDIENTSDAEEAREDTRVLSKQTLGVCLNKTVDCGNEESDGVSVIEESENEEPIANDSGNKVILCGTVPHRTESISQRNTQKEVTRRVYLFIACSLVIAVGIGLESRSHVQHTISKDTDYASIKMENDRLLERMREFNGVRDILEEIKTSINESSVAVESDKFVNPSMRNEAKRSRASYLNEHMNLLDVAINEPDTTIFERLQIFLRTMCIVLEDIRRTDGANRASMCDTRSFFSDYANLRLLLNSLIEKMDDSTKSVNQRFIEKVEYKITSISDSLVSDLTIALEKFNQRNQRKLEKIFNKMNERFCVLRNTMPSESKVRGSLDINDTFFVGNCENIVKRKFDGGRRGKKIMPQPPTVERKKSKNHRLDAVAGRSNFNQENSTKSYDGPTGYRENNSETSKCYGDNLRDFLIEYRDNKNTDETCSILIAPPRSSTCESTKHRTFSEIAALLMGAEGRNDEAVERKKTAGFKSAKTRLKGDGVASKRWKTKTLEESKNSKRSFSSNEQNNGYTRRMARSRSSPIESPVLNSDGGYKRVYPVTPTLQHRVKRRFDKPTTIQLDRRPREENIRKNGDWQFARCDRASSSRDTADIEGQRNNTVRKLLTPKASIEIVEKSQVDNIDIAIFLERILSLIGRVMNKLELAAALPIILADPETPNILNAAEMQIVRKAFNDHHHHHRHHHHHHHHHHNQQQQQQQQRANKTRCSKDQSVIHNTVESSSVSQQSLDDSETSSESWCSSTDDTSSSSIVYRALRILNGYSAIREKVKASEQDKMTPQSRLFLQHIKYYIEHCVRRIRAKPVEEKLRQLRYRKLWHENHRAQQNIDALLSFLDEQRMKHDDLMKTIGSQYRKDCDIVERLNRKCVEDMKSTVDCSERKQIMEHKYSKMRQNDLSQYLAISNNKLEILRETNLRLEQEIRSKRFKVSSQLTGQIGKFDAEVGERYRILEQLVEEIELDGRRKEKLEEETKTQFEACNIFIEEIERKKLAIFREKLDTFVRNRAARIIQRWLRPILARIKLKRKKNKAKKKNK